MTRKGEQATGMLVDSDGVALLQDAHVGKPDKDKVTGHGTQNVPPGMQLWVHWEFGNGGTQFNVDDLWGERGVCVCVEVGVSAGPFTSVSARCAWLLPRQRMPGGRHLGPVRTGS